MYTLWLTDENGEKVELATAKGSPFWTSMVQLAEETYGEENVSITFTPTAEHLKFLEESRAAETTLGFYERDSFMDASSTLGTVL